MGGEAVAVNVKSEINNGDQKVRASKINPSLLQRDDGGAIAAVSDLLGSGRTD